MAKIIFFALAALVWAEQIHAGNDVTFSDLQSMSMKHIEAIIKEINDEVIRAQKIVDQTVKDARNRVGKGLSRVKSRYDEAIKRVTNALSDATKGLVERKECKAAHAALVQSYNNLVLRTNKCVDSHIQGAVEHFNKINSAADDVLKKLNSIQNKVVNTCITKDRHGAMDLAKVTSCYGKSMMDSTLLLAKHAPYATLETARLSAYVATLGPRYTYCSSIQTVGVVYDDFSSNLGKISDCLL